jgi:hypothetical protein
MFCLITVVHAASILDSPLLLLEYAQFHDAIEDRHIMVCQDMVQSNTQKLRRFCTTRSQLARFRVTADSFQSYKPFMENDFLDWTSRDDTREKQKAHK